MNKIFIPFVLSSCIFFSGCAHIGSYMTPNQDSIRETQVNKTTYMIAAEGVAGESLQIERELLIKRAAEITTRSGYKYFAVIASDNDATYNQYTTDGSIHTYNYFNGSNSTINPPETHTVRRINSTIAIKIITNPTKSQRDSLFDADVILAQYVYK